jgi:YVTN family beta-propeller protein
MSPKLLRVLPASLLVLLLAGASSSWADSVVATIIVGNIEPGGGGAPSGIAFSPDGSFALVASNDSGTVSVINTSTNTVTATIPVGSPSGVAISPDGSFAYVTGIGEGGPVSVINTKTFAVTATITVGAFPVGVAISPDGSFAYVTNSGGNTVSVIKTSTNTVTATISVGNTPSGVAISPDGSFAYVTCERSNAVYVIDTKTNTVTATISLGFPIWIAFSPDGSLAYVVNGITNVPPYESVSVINTRTNAVIANIPTAQTNGEIAITPDAAFAYVTSTVNNTVTVINTTTDTISATIQGLAGAWGLAISPDGSYVYVGTGGGGTVSVIARSPTVSGLSPASVVVGQTTSVTITGTDFTNVTAVSFGSTAATSFTVNSSTSITAVSPPEPPGSVDVTVTSPGGVSVTSSADLFHYLVPSRLVNISARAYVGTGANILIAGFVIRGSGSKDVLLRGVGPTLALSPFDVPGVLISPQLTLVSSDDVTLAANSVWGGGATLTQAFAQVGAFALPASSADSAILTSLAAGAYTSELSGISPSTGVALAEVYDADAGTPPTQLINISARAGIGTGANILIAGFVVEGGTTLQVLLRGVGPTLGQHPFNVPGSLQTTSIGLYDSTSTLIESNTGWGNAPIVGTSTVTATIRRATAADMTTAGAFALPSESADSAMVATLPPGSYTLEVSGVNGSIGVGLGEVYLMP